MKSPENVEPRRPTRIRRWLDAVAHLPWAPALTHEIDRLTALVDRIERETLPFHFPRTPAEWDALTPEQRALAAIQAAVREFYEESAP